MMKPFGLEYLEEIEKIRAELSAAGVTDPIQLHFQSSRVYEERHKNDLSYRERQAIWLKEQREKQASKRVPGRNIFLTDEEIAYLIDHHKGANHPLVINLVKKLEGVR